MHSLILFSIILSTVSASGHLRLDLTSSTDSAIQLVTNILHAETVWLTMGETRTTSFHPLHQEDTIKVTFSMYGGESQEQVYPLKKTGAPRRDVFTFNNVAVLVEAKFECDEGFTGSKCLKPRATNPTTTTTVATTTTTATTSTTPASTSTFSPVQGSNSTFVLVLVLIVVIISIILLLICFIVKKKNQETYIEPQVESPEIKKKDLSLDSGFASPRYTVEPFTIVPISNF